MEKEFETILNRVVREEYGGCDPSTDNPCHLKARTRDGMIQVFVVGKWRFAANAGRKYPPSKAMQNRAERTIRINTGKTFQGKDITFIWEERPLPIAQAVPTIDEVKQALRIPLGDIKNHPKSLNWAINYIRQAYTNCHTVYEMKSQVPYILGNITSWRHPKAKEVRETLKRFMKEG